MLWYLAFQANGNNLITINYQIYLLTYLLTYKQLQAVTIERHCNIRPTVLKTVCTRWWSILDTRRRLTEKYEFSHKLQPCDTRCLHSARKLVVGLTARVVAVMSQRCRDMTWTTRRLQMVATSNDRTDHICQGEDAAAALCSSALGRRYWQSQPSS